jgi:hypothetical protein
MACAPSRSKAVQKSGLSTKRMTSRQSGDMSKAHGTNSGDKSKGLYSSGGPGRVGQDCPGFGSGYSAMKKRGPVS